MHWRDSRFLALFMVAAAVSIALLAVPAGGLEAQAPSPALSPGCATINNSFFDDLYRGASTMASFNAGERITVTGSPPYTVGTPATLTLSVAGGVVDTAAFPGTLTYTFSAPAAAVPVSWQTDEGNITWDVGCGIAPAAASAGEDVCVGDDGRVNYLCVEAWQTAAAYCTADGGVEVWAIDADGQGHYAFAVTPEDILAAGVPAENTLLAASADEQVRLYLLAGGEKLQVNAPKDGDPNGYAFIWDGCGVMP